MLPKWGYLIIIVVLNSLQKVIRKPYETRYKKSTTPMKIDRYELREKLVLYGLGVGILLVPMLWTFTHVLDFANSAASW